MVWWLALLLFAGTTVLSALLTRRPRDVQPSALGDFTFPTAQEGRAIPIVYGTVKLAAPNVVWYGDLLVSAIKKKSGGFFGLFAQKVVVGYKYFVGMQLALCHGAVDSIIQILAEDDKDVPFSTQTINGPAGEDYLRLTINAPELFGGDDKEGGISGTLDFYRGLETQEGSSYLTAQASYFSTLLGLTPAPPYRGLCHAVARKMYLGTSPFIKPLAFVVRRLPNALGLGAAFSNLGCDANPAEILYDLMRSAIYGLGIPASRFNLASFRAAAQTLAGECMGMSIIIDSPAAADQVIQDILRHIDGVLYTDPRTGLWTLELTRADYDPNTLLHLTEADLLDAPEFTRGSWEDTLNEVKIEYIDRDNNFKKATVQAHESANHATRGGDISSDTLNFHGFSNAGLAQRIAARELKALSFPLGKWTIRAKRQAGQLRFGRPFRLSWAPLCISNMVLRATALRSGRLEDGGIEIDAVEDIFGIGFTGYSSPGASQWQDPFGDPAPPTAQLALEAPYFLTAGDRFLLAAAVRANSIDLGFEIWSDEGGGFYRSHVAESFAPSGLLAGAYLRTTAALDTVGFTVQSGRDLERLVSTDAAGRARGDNLCLIDNEIISWTTVTDNGDGTFTLAGTVRGSLDTLPADHATGARVWFFSDGSSPSTEEPYASDFSGNIKCLPFNTRGVVDIGAVSAVPFTLASRAQKPYPPGKVQVNGDFWPAGITYMGDGVLTWQHRIRTQQPPVAQQDAANTTATPEGTYTVEVLLDGVVQAGRTQTGLTGTTFTYTLAQYTADDATLTKKITLRITPVNGALSGPARTTDQFLLSPNPQLQGQWSGALTLAGDLT